MRIIFPILVVVALAISQPATAQQLATRCHASSSFDVTVQPGRLVFDRPSPAPRQLVLSHGSLVADGNSVRLNAEDEDRLALFERELRALVPRVRAVGRRGVDIAVQALQQEAAGMGLGAASRDELDRRLAADAAELRQRIDASQSTHDWQGDDRREVGGDLGQQALQAAMSGDLDTAARLRDQAADLATALRPRLERRMQALAPAVDALCPSIRRLADLQQGVRDASGRPLDLLSVDGR